MDMKFSNILRVRTNNRYLVILLELQRVIKFEILNHYSLFSTMLQVRLLLLTY